MIVRTEPYGRRLPASSEPETLAETFDRLLDEHGVVMCLLALANAVRAENDRADAKGLPEAAIRMAAAREYLASQAAGLGAFWRMHAPADQRR